jgi:hypothetical protein
MATYDKAKYHFESVQQEGLPEIHAYIHSGLYLGWLIENNLLDPEFINDFGQDIPKFKNKEITAPQLFEKWDGTLLDDMLNEEGNKFTEYYFDFENGEYLNDYENIVGKGLPSLFHVKDTWVNFDTVNNFVSKQYLKWKKPKKNKWWQF